ncbi:pilus assembly protein PilP [Geomonas oryzisoli]|uniref:Pilus assembly protein PilP n=1 Tax=Geomonas oryzisoli TaxID=2847992 RepID=A0ABX8J4I7_9BACT|nr:pilus assembly protein PilP [Geomonas oryzisoli]QWV92021.1 pilus assembly protein PilP [Geomonas oryzisoli]
MLINRNSGLLLLLALALLAGCKKEEAPAPASPPPQTEPKPAPKPAVPVQQQLSSVAKTGGALTFKKDPFKPFLVPAAPAAPAATAGAGRPRVPAAELLPIQSFEVSKFKVAGIIAGLRENKALVIDPTGKGYVVQVGMQIGNANGRISRITASTVEVVERSGRKSKTIVLTLAKKR